MKNKANLVKTKDNRHKTTDMEFKNKPNVKISKIDVSYYLTSEYEGF